MVPRFRRFSVGDFPRGAPRRVLSPHLSVRYAHNQKGHNRFAVVIGKGFDKRSVVRHLWKRRLLHIVRTWPDFGCDILFVFGKQEGLTPQMLHLLLDKFKKTIRNS